MAVLLGAMIVAVLVIGCGNDADGDPERTTMASTTVTTGSLATAQYLAKINDYCQRDWARMLEKFADYQDAKGPNVSKKRLFIGASWRFLLPGIQFQFDVMRNSGAPEGGEVEVEEMIGTMQLAIESGQRQRISSAEQLSTLFEDYNRLAQQYGIDECVVDEAYFDRFEL
ncbi:MAG TPA: hypothetical protein VNP96_03530 [Solirubrobacterales bacterium]|nr:hypothetical protein [Solirubrobacterales bacterium]